MALNGYARLAAIIVAAALVLLAVAVFLVKPSGISSGVDGENLTSLSPPGFSAGDSSIGAAPPFVTINRPGRKLARATICPRDAFSPGSRAVPATPEHSVPARAAANQGPPKCPR